MSTPKHKEPRRGVSIDDINLLKESLGLSTPRHQVMFNREILSQAIHLINTPQIFGSHFSGSTSKVLKDSLTIIQAGRSPPIE